MNKVFIVILICVVILVIADGLRYRRLRRKNKHSIGHRRRTVNNDWPWDDERPGSWGRRWPRIRGPGRRRFNLNLFNRWFDLDVDFDFGDHRPWYTGQNVCIYKDVIKNETSSDEAEITSHHVIKSQVCDDRGSSYRCTKSLIVGGREEEIVETRECCRGFTRKEGQYGCPQVVQTKDLLTSATDMKLTNFLELLKISGLEEDLRVGNLTVFGPVDEAFDDIPDLLAQGSEDSSVIMVSQPAVDKMVSDLKGVLLGHLTPVIYTSSRLNDEQLIDTISPHKSKIRINFYDNELMTANCIKVKTRDNLATNGVIHVVEEILEPVSQSLLDIITKDPEMSYLKTAIGQSGLGNTFREEGQFTLFAPSDTAFRKLDPILLNRIMDGDTECLIKLLKNHVLPNVICSHAIQGRAKSKNLLGRKLNLTRDSDDKIFVHGAQAVDVDVMATNGVVYIIDEVLVPDDALDVLEIARRSGASAVTKIIVDNGLAKTLQTTQSITLFAPSDEAVAALEEIGTDPAELMKILTFHVVPSKVRTCDIYNGDLLDTLNGDRRIRFNEYSTPFPFRDYWTWEQTVQCASIVKPNIRACNGLIYIIDKVLIPPAGKILDVLASNSQFSELVQLVKIAEIGDMLEEEGPFTVFAPTNDAFTQFNDEELQKIVNDKKKLKNLLLNHVFKGQYCCAGLKTITTDFFSSRRLRAVNSKSFILRKHDDKLGIGTSVIETCDSVANNGVIHVINKVLVAGDRIRDPWWDDLFPDFRGL